MNKSESVHIWMCQNIGTTKQVASRRDILDIEELLNKLSSLELKRRICGSIREGFTLDSDVDYMNWYEKIRVIWNFSQAESYENYMLINADSSESPPGYVLLFLPSENIYENDFLNKMLSSALIKINNRICLSSSKFRQNELSSFPRGSKINGPCLSETLGHIHYDLSTGFASDRLPPYAASWADRCLSWPPTDVVDRIVRKGCHFVAVGHKLGNHEDNEWRISFSVAEYELVRSMNHTQFLTYGLLKLMLEKKIKKFLCTRNEHKLLNSYHIKTVVFWAIQQNTLHHWCPQNMLAGFWICFKLLLKWVYEGICPNFFIPENNMFKTKMHGFAHQHFFRKLYRMYENGIYACQPIKAILCNLTYTNRIDENSILSEDKFDAEFFENVDFKSAMDISSLNDFDVTEKSWEQLINLPRTQYEIVMLQRHASSVFQSTAFILRNINSFRRTNKLIYIADKVSCQMLKLATKWGFLSDVLYFAMYYYKTMRYREALSLLDTAKKKLDLPYFLYCGSAVGNPRTVDGLSLSKKMRRVVIGDIRLQTDINYINELMPEQTSCLKNIGQQLRIPPSVFINMLTFLCSRHVDTIRTQSALNALKSDVEHASEHYGRISYEILGICQEIAGNIQDALNSYYKSLKQFPLPLIESATEQRIRNLRRSQR